MLERRTPLRRGTNGLKRTELKRGDSQLARAGFAQRKPDQWGDLPDPHMKITKRKAGGVAKVPPKKRSPQQTRRDELDREWFTFSTTTRAARPRCEAGPILARIWADDPNPADRARLACQNAAARCHGATKHVHHKHPTGSGGAYVLSAGLAEADVLAVCQACHTFIHDCGWKVIRFERYDLLRPWATAPDA
jgi:hypothetical protein